MCNINVYIIQFVFKDTCWQASTTATAKNSVFVKLLSKEEQCDWYVIKTATVQFKKYDVFETCFRKETSLNNLCYLTALLK